MFLFNLFLTTGFVPADRRGTTIYPIDKKADKEGPLNYIPINLTSVVWKVVKSHLKMAIMVHLTLILKISTSQHGCLPKRTCLTNLVMGNWVTQIMGEGSTAYIIFLDLARRLTPTTIISCLSFLVFKTQCC